MSLAWYPARALDPRRHADIRLHLAGAGWQIVGKIGRFGPTQMWAWLEWREALSEFVMLSPWRRLGPDDIAGRREPDLFRPMDGQAWPGELPEVVSPSLPMRRLRLPHGAPCQDAGGDEGAQKEQDWRKGYSLPGSISRQEAEFRLMRALKTVRSLPNAMPKGFRGMVAWPAILVEWADLLGREHKDPDHAPAPRFQPSPRDLDDMLVALKWFAGVSLSPGTPSATPGAPVPGRGQRERLRGLSLEQNIIAWRALDPPFSWRAIGDRLRIGASSVKRLYDNAIDHIWRLANGGIEARAENTTGSHAHGRAGARAIGGRADAARAHGEPGGLHEKRQAAQLGGGRRAGALVGGR